MVDSTLIMNVKHGSKLFLGKATTTKLDLGKTNSQSSG